MRFGGARRRHGLLARHRPIEQREEDQIVAFQIDRQRLGGFDSRAPVQGIGQPEEAGAARSVDRVAARPI